MEVDRGTGGEVRAGDASATINGRFTTMLILKAMNC